VSDASALQTEDVYEGVSSPQFRSSVRSGLLKPQKFTDVSLTTGNVPVNYMYYLLPGTTVRTSIARLQNGLI